VLKTHPHETLEDHWYGLVESVFSLVCEFQILKFSPNMPLCVDCASFLELDFRPSLLASIEAWLQGHSRGVHTIGV